MTDTAKSPAAPRAASTILLLRDGPTGLEVFMVVRHHEIDFASGALVFPGGRMEAADAELAREGAPFSDRLDGTARALRIAAIREAFEECGVLLARPAGEERFVPAERASALDRSAPFAGPDNVDALVGSATADVIEGAHLLVKDMAVALAAAGAKLTKALSLVPDHARAHAILGRVYMFTRRAAEGVAEFEHALALDPNLADARASIGAAKILIGRAEETEAHILEALRLSPRDTQDYRWIYSVGHAKLHIGS
jgi:8-oxo-dGTP pyrophosphatase MutT (NUDIX family)